MNPNDRFAIIPVHYGDAPADAIMVGPLPTIMENIPDSIARHDSLRTLQAARLDVAVITQAQKATRALQVQSFCDGVNQISARLDALEKRRSKKMRQIAAQQKADEEKQIADYLNTLPDPDADPASHVNTGDLSAPLPPTNSDAEGDLPAELLRATLPPPGDFPSGLDIPPQPKLRNPVSLIDADDY